MEFLVSNQKLNARSDLVQNMTTDEMERMLGDTLIGRLCMSDRDGKPYAIPLPFCWTKGSLFVRLPMTGRKGEVLSQNNRVCFEVDRFSDGLDEYASILIEGRLEHANDLDEKVYVKQVNDEKYHRLRRGNRPGHGRASLITDLPLRKLVVESLSGRRK